MDIKGDLAYLTISEQLDTGLASPIKINELDLHAARTAADAEVDRLEDQSTRDADELTHQERAILPVSLECARARSRIYRTIAMEKAKRAGGATLVDEAQKFIKSLNQGEQSI
jgi:hypothetical protein